MKKILFLCTGNSCRSQMAEGWGNYFFASKYKFYSAGTTTHSLNPLAVRVMSESDVDISGHTSKTLKDLSEKSFDVVFTVCSDADNSCPVFVGSKVIHFGFADPPKLTKGFSTEEECLPIYRRVRDEIKEFVMNLESYMDQFKH